MSKTKIAVIGFLVITCFFWGPVVLGLLGELLCGGVLVFSLLFQSIGVVGATALLVSFVAALFYFVGRGCYRAFHKRMSDPVLENSTESTILQNARYITTSRMEGVADDAISRAMVDVGWTNDDVVKAFSRVSAGPVV